MSAQIFTGARIYFTVVKMIGSIHAHGPPLEDGTAVRTASFDEQSKNFNNQSRQVLNALVEEEPEGTRPSRTPASTRRATRLNHQGTLNTKRCGSSRSAMEAY
jgi:hypothetical protein